MLRGRPQAELPRQRAQHRTAAAAAVFDLCRRRNLGLVVASFAGLSCSFAGLPLLPPLRRVRVGLLRTVGAPPRPPAAAAAFLLPLVFLPKLLEPGGVPQQPVAQLGRRHLLRPGLLAARPDGRCALLLLLPPPPLAVAAMNKGGGAFDDGRVVVLLLA